MEDEISCPVCSGNKPLWKSQRGMILVIGMLFSFLLLLADAGWGKIDPVGLVAFLGIVSGGGIYYFKARSEEVKEAAK